MPILFLYQILSKKLDMKLYYKFSATQASNQLLFKVFKVRCLISKKRASPIFFVCNTWMSHLQHTFRERTLIPSPCECQTVLVSCSYETEHTRQEWEEQNTEQDQNHGGHGLHQWGCSMVEACGIVTEPNDRGCKVG